MFFSASDGTDILAGLEGLEELEELGGLDGLSEPGDPSSAGGIKFVSICIISPSICR